ncbi:ribbon-helix-helix domain-containing protein [Winogradskyella pulchriflava]|uniref:Ribbon-helix-helix domain-containing protein n=1 Tax=Winogradskyella pulchriflava TaxID=1110688 RepID=A0ABV6Q8J6_9FLAO
METKINLRIEEFVKESLEKSAKEDGKSLSEYIRGILREYVEFEIEAPIQQESKFPEIVFIDTDKGYESTFEFTYLLTWLFCKYMSPVDINHVDAINALKRRVELVVSESTFSQELKMEFVKVLNDLNRFLVEPPYEGKQFYFSIPNNHLSFNYNMLMNEIWSKN